MKNVFKKGLILGELLAVLAAVGFSKSGEGRQFTAELQKDLKTLAKHYQLVNMSSHARNIMNKD